MKPLEIPSIGLKIPDFQPAEWWPKAAGWYLIWSTVAGLIGSVALSLGLLSSRTLIQWRLIYLLFWIFPLLWSWMQCLGLEKMLKEAEDG